MVEQPVSWQENQSHASYKPTADYEISVTKWAKCWHWAIDTDPSSILRMEFAGSVSRITFLNENGTYLAQGRAKTKAEAKAAALQAWDAL